ncbi:MAG: hypothetical protein CL424_14535 [Acidimicrobiaceae bacterium]|nr:hypothetical protein [Acidimicrobiaceae bacterium]
MTLTLGACSGSDDDTSGGDTSNDRTADAVDEQAEDTIDDQTADDEQTDVSAVESTEGGAATADDADASVDPGPVDVPTVAQIKECGATDYPCSWEDADTEVFDHSFALGEAARDAYVDGASLLEVAEQLATDDRIVSVLVNDDAVTYRVAGGLPMWILGDGAAGERGAPAPAPEWVGPAPESRPRDVVGDDPESKRALVISPYQYDFGEFDEGAEVAALYGGARGYEGNVDYYANTDTTQEMSGGDQFRNWDQYDVVHVSTHGVQQCDDSGCTTILLTGTEFSSQEILFGDDGGSTVVFTRHGNSQGISDSFMNRNYPGGLPDTVVVLSACETGRGADLTNSFGDGVVFSWTEPVLSDFARASSLALHRTLVETGSTTERAHDVVAGAGLASYEEEVPPETPTEPGTTLVLGSDGQFHELGSAELGGSEATGDGDGPVVEVLDQPDTPDTPDDQGETITVTLVRRGGGGEDLRVREVAWIDHPQDGGEMQPGDEVRVDIRDDADYLPVALRVEGLDPGTEGDTTLRLEVDGVEVDSWSASEGTPTGRWGEWLIEDDVRLLNRIDEDDEVAMKLTIDLPEGGQSVDEVEPVKLTCLTGIWRLRSQEFLDEIIRVAGQGQDITMTHRSGEYRVTLRDDGTYTGRRDQWQFASGTAQGTIVTTIDSTDPGSWSSSGDQLTISDPGSPATVRIQLEVGGQLQDLPLGMGSQTVGSDAISGTGTFTCEENVLTTTYDGITATFDFVGPAQ